MMRVDLIEEFVGKYDNRRCIDALRKTQHIVLDWILMRGVNMPDGFDVIEEMDSFSLQNIDPVIIHFCNSVELSRPRWLAVGAVIPWALKQSLIHLIKCRNALCALSSLNDDEGVFHVLSIFNEQYT